MPKEKELCRLGPVIRRRIEEFVQAPHMARSYLVGIVVDTPDSNLTPEYGGKPRQGA